MGWGDFGSNGSVHWRVHYHDKPVPGSPPVVHGIDDNKKHPQQTEKKALEIGEEKGDRGQFVITARFARPELAARALRQLQENYKSGATELVLRVDVQDFRDELDPRSPREAWEISVDW